jgi:hypothetical protein
MTVKLLKVLSKGGGEVVHSAKGRRQRVLSAMWSIGLGANMTGARILGPELVH